MIASIPDSVNMTNRDCRDKLQCTPESPMPPVNNSLELIDPSPEFEHDIQIYRCKDGYTLEAVEHELINNDGDVELPCILQVHTVPGHKSLTAGCFLKQNYPKYRLYERNMGGSYLL